MRMESLTSCPGCEGEDIVAVFPYNDLRYLGHDVDPDLAVSDFHLCRSCGLMYARRRQAAADFASYYERFAEWENRSYAVYPPPEKFIQGKKDAAVEITQVLAEQGLLRPDARVLHVRADGGALLAHLRDAHGVQAVYGLDVFETNRRFARDHFRLPEVEPLAYGEFRIPFGSTRFDLIVANHLLTHACRPRQAMAVLRERLSPEGALFLYNEQDHLLGFGRGASFLRDGINNFHKQVLYESSLLTLLRLGGFSGTVVGQRNTSPLVVARPAAPMARTDLPRADFTPQLEAFRTWSQAHEQRWEPRLQKMEKQRMRQKTALGALARVFRRIGKRLLGRTSVPGGG